MKINKTIAVSIMLGAAIVSGCQSGNNIDYTTVKMIQRNVTTEQQIRSLFGEPTRTSLDTRRGTKTLTYDYENNDNIKKYAAGAAGAVGGGLLGNLIGGGSGRHIATIAGAVGGGAVGSNLIDGRTKKQRLFVVISLSTDRVIDYSYTERGSRTQSWRPSTGPGSL